MARNGSGTYSRVTGTPYVYNTTIDQVIVNNEMDDIATALTNSVAKDGQTTMTASLPMGGFKLTGLGAGTGNGESVRYEQVGALARTQAKGVAAGDLVQVDQAVTATVRATTTTLGTTLQHTLSDTSANITAFNGVSGVTYHCRALGAGNIVHHATDLIVTQGLATVATAAGDTFDVEMITATTCRIKNYVRAVLAPGDATNAGTSGSFTLTATAGFTTTPSVTAYWRLNNNVVTLRLITTLTGTSNANNFVLGGIPANIRPTTQLFVLAPRVDLTTSVDIGRMIINTDGTAEVAPDIASAANTWSTSGTKSLIYGTFTWTLD